MSPRDSQPYVTCVSQNESAWLLLEETDELAPTPEELCELVDASELEEEPTWEQLRDHYRGW